MPYTIVIQPVPEDPTAGMYGETREIEIETREQRRASVPDGWRALSIRES